jgi:hypothetical protein
MNKLLILALLLVPVSAFGQVQKQPGAPTNFTWTFAVTDEAKISGFRLYSSPIQSGPFNNLQGSSAATARALTVPASFSNGTVKTFYVIRSFFTSTGGTVESGDSNSVEVDLAVPSPTGLQVN